MTLKPNMSAGGALFNAVTSPSLLWGLAMQEVYHTKWLVGFWWKNPKPHDNNRPSILLAPWFLCNADIMTRIWGELEDSHNVYYSRVSRIHWLYKNVEELSTNLRDEIAEILKDKERNGDLTLMWHSLWWVTTVMATMLGTNIKVRRVIQLASTNKWWTPLGNLFWIKWLPAIKDMQRALLTTDTRKAHIEESVISVIAWQNNLVPPQFQANVCSLMADRDNFIPTEHQSGEWVRAFSNIPQTNYLFRWSEHTDFLFKKPVIEEMLRITWLKR